MYDTLQTVSQASESKWFLNFLFSMPPKNSNLYSNMTSKINKWMDVWIKKKKNCHENEPTILQMVEQVLVSWVTSVAHLLQVLMRCMLRDYLLHTLVHYNKQLQPRCESYCCLWSHCYKLNNSPLTCMHQHNLCLENYGSPIFLFQFILCKP